MSINFFLILLLLVCSCLFINYKRIGYSQLDPNTYFEIIRLSENTAKAMKIKQKLLALNPDWKNISVTPIEKLSLLKVLHYDFDGQVKTGEILIRSKIDGELIEHIKRQNQKVKWLTVVKTYTGIPKIYQQKNFKEFYVNQAMLEFFRDLYLYQFPIQSIKLIEEFNGYDSISMSYNNTHGFRSQKLNVVTGANGEELQRWSQHAYGLALDINPVQNPYVKVDSTQANDLTIRPKRGSRYISENYLYEEKEARAQRYFLSSKTNQGVIKPHGIVDQTFKKHFGKYTWYFGGYWSSATDYMHYSWNNY